MNILKSTYGYFLATRLRARHILKFLNLTKENIFLDVGCGIGYFSVLLEQKGYRAIGMDIDIASLQMAQSSYKGKFLCADIRRLPFKDSAFNKILASEILEHLPKEDAALEELKRVCTPGGELVVTTPCTEGLLSFAPLRLLGHNKPGGEFHYRYGYTKKELQKLLLKHEFLTEKVSYSTGIISELVIQLLKLGYFLKRSDFSRQADFISVEESLLFRFYKKFIFPIVYAIGIFEDEILNKFFKGHTLVIKAKAEKQK